MSGASDDDRPPMVVAMRWVHQITAIAAEITVPPVVGHFLDQRWHTEPWLVVVGALLGFAAGMVQLLSLARQSARRDAGRSARDKRIARSAGSDQGAGRSAGRERGAGSDRSDGTDQGAGRGGDEE